MPGLLDYLAASNPAAAGLDPRVLSGLLGNRQMFDPSTISGGLFGALAGQANGSPQQSSPQQPPASLLPGATAALPTGLSSSAVNFAPQPQGFASLRPGAASAATGGASPGAAAGPVMPAAAGAGAPTAPAGLLANALPSLVGAPAPAGLLDGLRASPSADASAPYGSVPLNVGGKMLTRQQAENTDGLDHTDYDAVAQKQGMTPTPFFDSASAPSSPVSSGVALGSTLAAQAGAPLDVRPQAQGGPAATLQPGFGDKLGGVLNAIGGLYGRGGPGDGLIALGIGMSSGPGGLQRALSQISSQQQSLQGQSLQQQQLAIQQAKLAQEQNNVSAGADFLQSLNKTLPRAQAVSLASNPGGVSSVIASNFKTPEEKAAARNQFVQLPQADGTVQPALVNTGSGAVTPVGGAVPGKQPEAVRDVQYAMQNWQTLGLPNPQTNPQYWSDLAARRIGGGGVSVSTTLPPAEKASEAAYGKAEGDEFGAILKAGQSARQTQGQLALMSDAFAQGNGQISTGPFAKSILGAKQAILNTTGIDLGGIPESEAVQKLGFGLATNLTKEITQRPAQAEFLKALENVPGIFMSPQGSRVMISVLNQQAQQKIDLARLVSQPDNRKKWPDVEQAYFDAHPLLSPFTGKPLTSADVGALASQAQAAGIDPRTGQPIGAAPAIASTPSWSIVGN